MAPTPTTASAGCTRSSCCWTSRRRTRCRRTRRFRPATSAACGEPRALPPGRLRWGSPRLSSAGGGGHEAGDPPRRRPWGEGAAGGAARGGAPLLRAAGHQRGPVEPGGGDLLLLLRTLGGGGPACV